jgi:hypothetical protein
LSRSPEYIVNFMNLVKFIIAWKEREETEHLKEDTANAPVVHFVIVVTVSEETLRRTVPSS